MTQKRVLNVSGYRGIWGDTLTDDIVTKYARAFARFVKEDSRKENPTVLLGRDGRESGPEIKSVVIRELINSGLNVVDGEVLPTPTVLFSVRKHSYDGAIIVTASHNPIEYNGLKFVNKKALFTIKEEVEKIQNYFEREETASKNLVGKILPSPRLTLEHADKIVESINSQAIREKKFKVVVDMINASASVIDPYLFEKLGVTLIPLNNIPNGKFTHKPEPLKENLGEVAELVKKESADIGYAHDPDADRLVIIDEHGEVISEEYSVALAVENVLSKNPGRNAVINLSTSQMSVDIAKKYGSEIFRSIIGEGYVTDKIIEKNAVIGGEGNGGVIFPSVNLGRDSFVALALVLELLAKGEQTISQLVSTLPKYFIKKSKWPREGSLDEMYSKLKSKFKEAEINEEDGLRLDFSDSTWIHIRPSNTEPILRVFGEAKEENRINSLFEEVKLTLGLK